MNTTYWNVDGAKRGLKSGLSVEPIFVGREEEIKKLEVCLNSDIDKKGKTLFISGEAGPGKPDL